MKIDKTSKLEKCAATSPTRYAMDVVYLDLQDKKHPVAVATDGKVLAVVPVELEDGDEAGMIPIEALKEARRGAGRGDTARIEVNGTLRAWGKKGPVTYERPDDVPFPDWRAVTKHEAQTTDKSLRVCLNAKLLLNLAQALGSDSVELRFQPFDTDNGQVCPMDVRPVQGGVHDAHGVIMPITGI